MKRLVSFLVWMGSTLLLAQSPIPLRPALVTQPGDAPVELISTHTVDGRMHGAATVHNIASRPVNALTFVITLGDPEQPIALRRTDVISTAMAPGATLDVSLPGIAPAAVTALLPAVAQPVAELGLVAVTFADGSSWRLRNVDGWLGRSDRKVSVQCLDSSNELILRDSTVLDAAVQKQCRAGGLLIPTAGGIQ